MNGDNQPVGRNVRLSGKKRTWPWVLILIGLILLALAALWPRIERLNDSAQNPSGTVQEGTGGVYE